MDDRLDLKLKRRAFVERAQRRLPRLRGNLRQLGAVGRVVMPVRATGASVVVKVSVTKAHTTGAHLGYLTGAGKGLDGERAVLYGPGMEDRQAFVHAAHQDPRQFRIIISPAGLSPAMQTHLVERLMQHMARDLERPVSWLAANHYDTAHPHTHVVVRAVDGQGQEWYMTRHYFLEGLQHRAQALLNWLTQDRTAEHSTEIPAHLTAAREQIEADMTQTKRFIEGIVEKAGEHTWALARDGLMIRQGQIVPGGREDGYEAVTHHPVWGEEIRDAYASERSAGIERGPLSPVEYDPRWQAMERWSDEVFAARQTAGEIPAFHSRSSWESSRLHEPGASTPAVQAESHAPALLNWFRQEQLSSQSAEIHPPPRGLTPEDLRQAQQDAARNVRELGGRVTEGHGSTLGAMIRDVQVSPSGQRQTPLQDRIATLTQQVRTFDEHMRQSYGPQAEPHAPRLTRADSDQLSTTVAELRSLMSQDRQGQSTGMEMGD